MGIDLVEGSDLQIGVKTDMFLKTIEGLKRLMLFIEGLMTIF